MPLGIITADRPIPVGTTIALMARIVGQRNALVTQSTVSTVTYLLWNQTDNSRVQPSSGTRSLTIADVIFNTLQTKDIDPSWTKDGAGALLGPDGRQGYVFRYLVPASDTAAAQAEKTLRATLTFSFTDGTTLTQLFQWVTLTTNA